jgi:hypothetical protein
MLIWREIQRLGHPPVELWQIVRLGKRDAFGVQDVFDHCL